jgi:hypothetical protein
LISLLDASKRRDFPHLCKASLKSILDVNNANIDNGKRE